MTECIGNGGPFGSTSRVEVPSQENPGVAKL